LNRLKKYDFLIVGSGFGGSIMAMALSNLGYCVCVVERGEHPRFAIGESSTPIADMILRDLAVQYNLPFLKEISRYGEWQKHHPDVNCGLKRGFSYYPHQKEKPFDSDANHINELLVAASIDDENSDTNWLRSDVDHFLIQQLQKMDVDYFDSTTVSGVEKTAGRWNIQADRKGEELAFTAGWIIDATGSTAFAETFLGVESTSEGFHTNSFAVYSHVEGAAHWQEYLHQNGFHISDYPYNPDHSALHHLTEEGWIWMLRFNNDLLSAGVMIDLNSTTLRTEHLDASILWNSVISTYPSVQSLFKNAKLAEVPGRMLKTGRLQRRLNKIYGDCWIALNHTAGFVDPLHSTGLAHTLKGVEKVLNLFSGKGGLNVSEYSLRKIQGEFYKELELIDILVSSSYLSREHFEVFTASVMLYFAASIRYEQERLAGKIPDTFLCAGDRDLQEFIFKSHRKIKQFFLQDDLSSADVLVDQIRKGIEPFNRAGLMDPEKQNMYAHTAVTL
jgi:tetracycline 7-halogenase / FADH2 O2-dependent halogenase